MNPPLGRSISANDVVDKDIVEYISMILEYSIHRDKEDAYLAHGTVKSRRDLCFFGDGMFPCENPVTTEMFRHSRVKRVPEHISS